MTDSQGATGERLKEIRSYLRLTLAQFYSPITPHYNNLSAVENGVRTIGKRMLKEIAEYYSINPEYLLNGTGEKFVEGGDPFRPVKDAESGVPYFNIDLANLPEASAMLNEKPEFYVDYKPFNDCHAYLPVYGDSMYPRFASGEIIAVKQIKNFEVIQWGEAYLVITDSTSNNLRSVKMLFQHHDPEKIILRSSNPNYKGDTVIKRSSIVSLYIIKGKITRTLI